MRNGHFITDYHCHSTVSPDGHNTMREMAEAAVRLGVDDLCFTDHIEPLPWDRWNEPPKEKHSYDWAPMLAQFREAQEDTGSYKLVNTTGTTVSELYVYLNGGEKGENLALNGMEDGASVDFTITAPVDASLTLEFTTEADGTKTFETLHIENVTVNLLAADAMSGATPIQFGF